MAFSGTEFLVAWTSSSAPSESRISGTRVGTDGTVRDAAGLTLGPQNTAVVGMAGLDNGYLLLTAKHYPAGSKGPFASAELYAASVSTAGLSTPTGTALGVTLAGTDPDADPLTFEMVTPPAHRTLSGTPPALTYTPAPGYTGPDSFTFRASDCMASSAPATVAVSVGASGGGGGGGSGTPPPGAVGGGDEGASSGGCAAAGGGGALGLLPLALLLWRRRSRAA